MHSATVKLCESYLQGTCPRHHAHIAFTCALPVIADLMCDVCCQGLLADLWLAHKATRSFLVVSSEGVLVGTVQDSPLQDCACFC